MYDRDFGTNISPEYRQYLKSKKWRDITERILLRDDFQCRLCGSREHLHCHHIRGRHRFHEEDHPEDLCILCENCHYMIHSYFKVCDSIREYYEQKSHEQAMRRGYYW